MHISLQLKSIPIGNFPGPKIFTAPKAQKHFQDFAVKLKGKICLAVYAYNVKSNYIVSRFLGVRCRLFEKFAESVGRGTRRRRFFGVTAFFRKVAKNFSFLQLEQIYIQEL